jgi:hypothetical protein
MMKTLPQSNQLLKSHHPGPHALRIVQTTYVTTICLPHASQFAKLIIDLQLALVISDGDESDNGKIVIASSCVKPKVIARSTNTASQLSAMSTSASSGTSNAKSKQSKTKSEASFSSSSANGVHEIPACETDGLPAFARVKWSTSFLPTLYACLGSSSSPWKLYEDGSSMVDTIQGILDMVYPNSGYRVKLGDKIFSMVRMALTTCSLKHTNTLLG